VPSASRGFQRLARHTPVALGACCGLALLLILAAGTSLTKASRHPVGPAPSDLHAVSVVIPTTGGGFVKGWLAPGSPGSGVILLLHGVRSDRRQMVGRAGFLRAAGFATLLIDLPAHGESSGDRITFGAQEAVAVRAALAYLRKAYPQERIGVIGVSLGAASLVLSHPSPAPDAVVLESMYPTIADATRDRIAIRLGPGGTLLAPLLLWQLPIRIGVSQSALRPISDIRQLRSPLLLASGTADRHTTLDETRRIFAAANEPKALWEVSGAAHVDLYRFAPDRYRRRTLPFLVRNLRRAVPAAQEPVHLPPLSSDGTLARR
jgi:fermentation-respiration switch protein FrsA (DUF1100 family)